jgi:hypothetical protein
VSFSRDLSELPAWEDALIPMVLYFDLSTSEWVLVATTNACEVWSGRNKPRWPYWEYRVVEGRWREEPVAEHSFGLQANLIDVERLSNQQHVDLELKRALLSDRPPNREYAEIWKDPGKFICAQNIGQ